MANYRRLISYIYAYEGDIKGKNIGFVKLESRNGQCRLSINVKKVYVGGSDLGVYLLSPGKEIGLGNIFIRGGSGEFRASVAVDNVGDSGIPMEECYGLSIHEPSDEWRSYRTIWEDAVAHAARVELEETAPPKEKKDEELAQEAKEIAAKLDEEILENEKREKEKSQSGAEPLYDIRPVKDLKEESVPAAPEEPSIPSFLNVMDNRRDILQEEMRENRIAGRPFGNGVFQRAKEAQARPGLQTEPEASKEAERPAEPEVSKEAERPAEPEVSQEMERPAEAEVSKPPEGPAPSEKPSPEPQELILEDPGILEQLEQEEKAAMRPGQLWEMFSRRWPKIQAFDCTGGCEILTIKPQDIGLMPREIWTYGNNSFLLHGYYNYRYLILAKVGDPDGKGSRYILGVPGNYYSNEKYMASMFGFPHFVLAKRQSAPGGRFGYWYTDIRLDHFTA